MRQQSHQHSPIPIWLCHISPHCLYTATQQTKCQGAICITDSAVQALRKHVSKAFVLQGELQSQQPWYNLSCQSPQPTVRLPSTRFDPFTGRFQTQLSDQLSDHLSNPPPLVASLCNDFAFRSGSCLQIKGATACIDACVLPVMGVVVGLQLGQTYDSGVIMSLRLSRLCCFLFIIQLHAVNATLTLVLLHCKFAYGCCFNQQWSEHGVAAFVSHVFPMCFALCCPVLTCYDTVQLSEGMSPLQEMWPQGYQHQWKSSQLICSSLSQVCASASPTRPLPSPPLPTWSCGAGWSPASPSLPLPVLLPAVTLKVSQLCCSYCMYLSCCCCCVHCC